MSVWYIIYLHISTFWLAPVKYTEYMLCCLIHLKKPNTKLLGRLSMVRYMSKTRFHSDNTEY